MITMPAPAFRDGRVLIPTTWSVLAFATLEDPGASVSAAELARVVLEAADRSVKPTPDLVEAFA